MKTLDQLVNEQNAQIENLKNDFEIQILNHIESAVDRVVDKTEWIGENPSQSAKMKVSTAKKFLLYMWDESNAYGEAIGKELGLERPSDWIADDPKVQIEHFISYLQGFIENASADDINELVHGY